MKTSLFKPTVYFGSLLIIFAVSLTLFFTVQRFPNLTGLNDSLFISSMFAVCAGSISAIVSKSRKHYYRHLQDKFTGKTDNDHSYDTEQQKRDNHANFALTVALSGLTGLGLCTLLLLFNT